MNRQNLLVVVLWANLGLAAIHGITHALIPVELSSWQYGIILFTTVIGPIIGVKFALRSRPIGILIFTVALSAALYFGLYHHFFEPNPDHIHHIPEGIWQSPFKVSAVGVAVTNALGVGFGVYFWYIQKS